MPVIKQDHVLPFERVYRGAAFAFTTTLYTKSDGKEDPKEHLFYKLNAHKAVTLDKRITIHMLPDTKVNLCVVEKRH